MRAVLKIAAGLLAGTTLVLSAPLAMANDHGHVNWSVSIGTPYPAPVYSPPPVVYVEPRPVYVQPQPVYVRPQPVYVERVPMMEYRSYSPQPYYSQPYYVDEVRYRKHHHWKHHHRNND